MSSALRLSIAGLMLLAATALGLITYTMNQPKQAQEQTAPPPLLISYFVAAHPLPAGTLAREEDLTTRALPSSDLPAGAIVDSPDARTALRGSLVMRMATSSRAAAIAY